MIIRLQCEHPRGGAASRRLRRHAREFLRAMGREEAELSILLVTDRAIRTLNRRWRQVDRATDVLSFEVAASAPEQPLLGDVVISLDTALRRAREDGREVGLELDRYLAHGLLHLLGYDHHRPQDARRMAAQELALVRAEGLVGAVVSRRRNGPSET